MRPIRYGDVRTVITTADDTTITLSSPTKRYYLFEGTGILAGVVLPDATKLQRGTPFVFENCTPEFVGVRNSSSSTWWRVPPRATLSCTVCDVTTAAGVWFSNLYDPAIVNPAYGYSAFEDFSSAGAVTSSYSFTGLQQIVVASGTGARFEFGSSVSNMSAGGRQGTGSLTTGTTTTGYALLHYGGAGYLGNGCRSIEVSMSISAISSAADEYIARFGIGDNVTGGTHTEGAYLLYNRYNGGGTALTNWQFKTIKTAGGAANTQTDTGVAPTFGTAGTDAQNLRIEIASGGARADAWLDRVQVSPSGGHGNLPASSTAVKISHVGITKTEDAGTTARYIKMDYLRLQSYPTVPR